GWRDTERPNDAIGTGESEGPFQHRRGPGCINYQVEPLVSKLSHGPLVTGQHRGCRSERPRALEPIWQGVDGHHGRSTRETQRLYEEATHRSRADNQRLVSGFDACPLEAPQYARKRLEECGSSEGKITDREHGPLRNHQVPGESAI